MKKQLNSKIYVMIVLPGTFRQQQVLKQKPCEKPERSIIQTDQLFDMVAGTFVVPGTELFLGKKSPGSVFGGEDAEHVYNSPKKGREFSDEKTDWFQENSHAIDKKHKDRSVPHTGLFPTPEGLESSEQYFQAPSKDATMKKGNHKFFHANSIAGFWKNIPAFWEERQIMQKESITKYSDAIEYMERAGKGGIVPGLDSMKRLMAKLGNPQDMLQFVHIAGTNGKGSVLSFVSGILKCAGYRTGRYSSPAVFSDLEKYQVGGRTISQKDYVKGLEIIRKCAEELEEDGYPYPTAFELETALAFWYFRENECDIVVLESGMGGLLDATNIITTTVVAVLTPIGIDHACYLGDTLEEIAFQKAGIIKNECYVISAKQDERVMEIITKTCKEKGATLKIADVFNAVHVRYGLEKQRFTYGELEKLVISLGGKYQIENAVLAVETIKALQRNGYHITEKILRRGLMEAKWRGRFTVISKRPLFIIDGAHNEEAVQKLKESVTFYFTNKRIITIIGVLRDKEYEKIAKLMAPLAQQVITVATPGNRRAFPAYELAGVVRRYNPNVTAADSLEEAVEMARLLADADSVIVAFGSLSYLGKLSEIVSDKSRIRRDAHGRSGKN